MPMAMMGQPAGDREDYGFARETRRNAPNSSYTVLIGTDTVTKDGIRGESFGCFVELSDT
jgi:hypothetical protein